MSSIEKIDKNFAVKSEIKKENTVMYNILEYPFSIHGLLAPNQETELFHRLPKDIAANVNEGVLSLYAFTAGGRVRFKTNSSYIGIKAVMGVVGKLSYFALSGTAGFDLYSGIKHLTTFSPSYHITNELFGEYKAATNTVTEYTLNFPLYSEVKELYVILDKDAVLEEVSPYKNKKPFVYYGSSITQGACASRPGTAYQAVLSRKYNIDYVNLGFSGNARGEAAMAEYIAGLEMSAFVYDYDHNAPSAQHLEDTHLKFLEIIRKKHKDIPVICISRPMHNCQDYAKRKQIIENTVLSAKKNGDNNIYFINMCDYFNEKGIKNEASVDLCHPNDLGFYFMADAIGQEIEKFL